MFLLTWIKNVLFCWDYLRIIIKFFAGSSFLKTKTTASALSNASFSTAKNLKKYQWRTWEGLKDWRLKDWVLESNFGKSLSEYQNHNGQSKSSISLYLVSFLFICSFRIADNVSMSYIATLQLANVDLEPCQ